MVVEEMEKVVEEMEVVEVVDVEVVEEEDVEKGKEEWVERRVRKEKK